MAYALTIHKSQGLTLDRVAVDIGEKEQAIDLTYFALSQVKTLDGLLITKNFNYSRLENIGRIGRAVLREKFMADLRAEEEEDL